MTAKIPITLHLLYQKPLFYSPTINHFKTLFYILQSLQNTPILPMFKGLLETSATSHRKFPMGYHRLYPLLGIRLVVKISAEATLLNGSILTRDCILPAISRNEASVVRNDAQFTIRVME